MTKAKLTFIKLVSTSGRPELVGQGYGFLFKYRLQSDTRIKELIIPITADWPSLWERYTQAFGINGHQPRELPVFWQEIPHEGVARDYVTPNMNVTKRTAFFCLQTAKLHQMEEAPMETEELT